MSHFKQMWELVANFAYRLLIFLTFSSLLAKYSIQQTFFYVYYVTIMLRNSIAIDTL